VRAERPRVAVITPTYQHVGFVQACIESVINQTVPDWEMVVIDDGSTDGTADVADGIGDPRVRVVRKEHAGLADLRQCYQLGLTMTTAPLVAVLEGDDTWPADKLSLQLPLFDDPDVVLSYGKAGLIDAKGRQYATYDRHPRGPVKDNTPVGSIVGSLASNNFIVAATVIVRREAVERIGGFWQPVAVPYVDHPTWLKLALEGQFKHTEALVGNWRRHSVQYTTSNAASLGPTATGYLLEIAEIAAEKRLTAVDRTRVNLTVATDESRRHAHARLGAGRLQLLSGDWRAARRTFRGLIDSSPGRSALMIGLIGWAAAAARLDIEWVFRMTGRLSWPPRG